MTLIKEAVTKRPFHQLPFISEKDFSLFLRDRGFDVGVGGIHSFVEAGLIEKLGGESGDFHPFQIWPISKLLRELEIRMDWGISHYGLDPVGLKSYFDINWDCRAKPLTDFPKSEACREFNQQMLPLLLWIESYFLPVVRGPRHGVVNFVGFDPESWHEWKNRTEVGNWLNNHSVSLEQFSEWRNSILFQAYNIDPAPDSYLLFRSMPFEHRNQFKGRLRLAYDLYEIAEVTRLFLERVSEKPVRKEWYPTGPPNTAWVEWIYGSQPKFGSPEFLRPVIRHYGIDPSFRVRWLVEGETEEGFILRYSEKLGANIREFVTILNFGGDGAFKKQIKAMDDELKVAREEQCFVTLTFDTDSDGVRTRAETLVRDELVNLRYVLNEPDFETENFSVELLVRAATAWASDLSNPITSNQSDLIQEVKSRIDGKRLDFRKALNDVLHLRNEQYRLSKGSEWGRRLANHLIDKREGQIQRGVYSESDLSKIEQQILYVIRSSQPSINYPASVSKLEPTALEILRRDSLGEP